MRSDLAHLYVSLAHLASHYARAKHWRKTKDGPRCVHEPLKRRHLEEHLTAGAMPVGLAFVAPGEDTTRAALLDLDDHGGRLGWDEVASYARNILTYLTTAGYRPHTFKSTGGKGVHIILLWEEPQDAYSVRMVLADALSETQLKVGVKGLEDGQVEVFPKQNSVPADGAGSMAILPLAKESVPLDENLRAQEPDIVESVAYWQYSPPVKLRERPAPTRGPSVSRGASSAEQERLTAALSTIPNDCDYEKWFQVLCAVHYEWDGSAEGEDVAYKWSATSDKHTDAMFAKKWNSIGSFSGPPTTGGTLLKMAREAGGEDDVSGMFEALSPETVPTGTVKPNRFKIIPDRPDFIDHPEPDWFIQGVLPKAELLVVYGRSMAGKSFVALDMAYAITRGIPWGASNLRVKQGVVVYIAAEGAGGMRKRVRAYYHQHQQEGSTMHFITDAPNLTDNSITSELIRALCELSHVDLVVVDTLAQSTAGADENSGRDMGHALGNCKTIHKVTGASVMLIHHAGKDESKGARGWSGLQAAADGEYEVRESESGQRQLKITKLKDDECGAVMPFKLLPVDYAHNEHGEAIGSAIVEWMAESERDDGEPTLKGAWQKAIYDVHSEDVDGNLHNKAALIEAAHDHLGRESNAQSRKNCKRALGDLLREGVILLSEDGVNGVNSDCEGGSDELC